jgi:branched-chain amino acid transport system ATP-binding protein
VLKVYNLDVYYGDVQALRRVSIDVSGGEIVTLIGANGAGKTTFVMTLSGIKKPNFGTIEFFGRRTDKLPPDAIISAGMVQVPQGRLLFPDMTVLENLEMGACKAPDTNYKSIEQKMEEIYSYFEVLKSRRNQKAGTLSGGEQQMLAIGRALMASPKLLLMDEPTSGLAPIIVEHLAEIITDLRRVGLSILLIEQNAYLALELADRGYVLETGRIVASGNASHLLQSDLVKRAYLGI